MKLMDDNEQKEKRYVQDCYAGSNGI